MNTFHFITSIGRPLVAIAFLTMSLTDLVAAQSQGSQSTQSMPGMDMPAPKQNGEAKPSEPRSAKPAAKPTSKSARKEPMQTNHGQMKDGASKPRKGGSSGMKTMPEMRDGDSDMKKMPGMQHGASDKTNMPDTKDGSSGMKDMPGMKAGDSTMKDMPGMQHGPSNMTNMPMKEGGSGMKGMSGMPMDSMSGMGPMQGGSPPMDARDPDAYAEGMPKMSMPGMDMADDKNYGQVLVNELEYAKGRDARGQNLNLEAWYGGDYNKLWLKAEGERQGGRLERFRTEALWDHTIATFWSTQIGARQDNGGGPSRTWLALGVQGLALLLARK